MRFTIALGCVALCLVAFAESDIAKVKGVGTGETEELALTDAYRDAVESAVGMYVDSEQAAKNDEVIKDEILTQTNAYIEDYDVIDKKTENGVVKIKILARVRKQALTKKISGSMKAKTVKVGGGLKNLHAQMTTTEKKSCDGAALLEKALEGVDPMRQLMEVSLVTGEPVVVPEDSRHFKSGRQKTSAEEGKVEVAYLFKFEINRDRYYKEFLPNLERVMTQVAEQQPREITINSYDVQDRHYDPDSYCRGDTRSMRHNLTAGSYGGAKRFESSALGSFWLHPNGRLHGGRDGALDAVVVSDATDSLSSIQAKVFRIDSSCAEVVARWAAGRNSRIVGRNSGPRGNVNGLPVYTVSFCDADGRRLISQEISVPKTRSDMKEVLSSVGLASSRQCTGSFWYVTPFVGCQAKAYYQWFSFRVPKEDLPKIDSIKIELSE